MSNEFDQKLQNVSRNEFLQLLGLSNATEMLDPKVFSKGKQKGIETHLVYLNKTLRAEDLDAASFTNPDAEEAFTVAGAGQLLLNPEAEAVFLLEDEVSGEVEAVALTNPWKHGRRVQYRRGDSNDFREEFLDAQPWCPHASVNAVDYEAEVEVPPGEDPHVVFYTAAHELRDRIAADTAKLTRGLSGSAVLATTVFTPIVAMPKPDKGFYVHCSIGQMVFAKSSVHSEGQPISRTGEIPIQTPSAVEMKMLMFMDEELEEMGLLDVDRNKPKVLPVTAVKEAFRRGARAGKHKPTK